LGESVTTIAEFDGSTVELVPSLEARRLLPFADEDILEQTYIVDFQVDAAQEFVRVLLDLRASAIASVPPHGIDCNVALVECRGVTHFESHIDREPPLILDGYEFSSSESFQLRLLGDAVELSVRSESMTFAYGVASGLTQMPPDYGFESAEALAANTPTWLSPWEIRAVRTVTS
jgi:hypothetical protein